MRSIKSRRLRFLAVTILFFLSLLLLLRGIFYLGFSELFAGLGETANHSSGDVLQAAWIGIRFDFRLALVLALPLAIFAFLPKWNLVTSSVIQKIAAFYFVIAVALVLVFYIIDFGHYAYLGIRIDSTALRFAEDTFISGRMVWESYPVIWIALAWLLLTFISALVVQKLISLTLSKADPMLNKKQIAVAVSITLVVVIFGSLGRFSLVPLRWNNAFFSGDVAVAALGLNPVLYFFDTFQFRETPYQIEEVNKYYAHISHYLGVSASGESKTGQVNVQEDELNYVRYFTRSDHAVVGTNERPPNVIFIMLESLGASRLGAYGNPLKPSPVLDRIAKDGWFFHNFYVPVSGTSRTVFASVTGLPDVTSVATATRNPFISEQHTIINAFSKHEKYYFIGGSAGWANMGALIKRSIKGVKLFQEGDYTESVVDVWGISDLSLFREANARFSKIPKDQPFFAILQTAGNHRPFTVPDDNEGFEKREVPEDELEHWGYRNIDQFNAVRLLDYNLGLFLDMAKAGGYLDNTLFVFYGDHNNRITSTPHMAPFYEVLDLDGLHVPHMIYGPKYLQPREFEQAASLVDVLPTIAGLLGVNYVNTGMGRDINNDFPEEERVVYTHTSGKRAPVIGAVTKDLMLRMNYDGTDSKLHDLNSDDPGKDIGAMFPEKKRKLTNLARGIYETSKYLHSHNQPQSHSQLQPQPQPQLQSVIVE